MLFATILQKEKPQIQPILHDFIGLLTIFLVINLLRAKDDFFLAICDTNFVFSSRCCLLPIIHFLLQYFRLIHYRISSQQLWLRNNPPSIELSLGLI